MLTLSKLLDLTKGVDAPARVLMSLLFLISGVGKLAAVVPTQAYMQGYGVPGILIWPAAAWEICGGLLLLTGLWARPLALLLAGWCLLTAFIFHTAWGDQVQMIMFLKNMTMAGGFLVLAKTGAGFWHRWSAFFSQRGTMMMEASFQGRGRRSGDPIRCCRKRRPGSWRKNHRDDVAVVPMCHQAEGVGP
jgi:putative oxidoreductase